MGFSVHIIGIMTSQMSSSGQQLARANSINQTFACLTLGIPVNETRDWQSQQRRIAVNLTDVSWVMLGMAGPFYSKMCALYHENAKFREHSHIKRNAGSDKVPSTFRVHLGGRF